MTWVYPNQNSDFNQRIKYYGNQYLIDIIYKIDNITFSRNPEWKIKRGKMLFRKKKAQKQQNERQEEERESAERMAHVNQLQEAFLNEIERRISDIRGLAEVGEKIIALDAIRTTIDERRQEVHQIYSGVASKKASEYLHDSDLGSILGPNAFKFALHEVQAEVEALKSREATHFLQRLNNYEVQIKGMLDWRMSHCSLEELSVSPHFTEIYKKHETIRDRFTAAAAARAALGEKKKRAIILDKPARPF